MTKKVIRKFGQKTKFSFLKMLVRRIFHRLWKMFWNRGKIWNWGKLHHWLRGWTLLENVANICSLFQ